MRAPAWARGTSHQSRKALPRGLPGGGKHEALTCLSHASHMPGGLDTLLLPRGPPFVLFLKPLFQQQTSGSPSPAEGSGLPSSARWERLCDLSYK